MAKEYVKNIDRMNPPLGGGYPIKQMWSTLVNKQFLFKKGMGQTVQREAGSDLAF